MVEITWSDEADENLNDIFDFIEKDSPYYAKKQIEQILDRVEILQSFPLSGKIVSGLNDESVRELVEGNYRIIYEILSAHSIWILTVHHHARDLKLGD